MVPKRAFGDGRFSRFSSTFSVPSGGFFPGFYDARFRRNGNPRKSSRKPAKARTSPENCEKPRSRNSLRPTAGAVQRGRRIRGQRRLPVHLHGRGLLRVLEFLPGTWCMRHDDRLRRCQRACASVVHMRGFVTLAQATSLKAETACRLVIGACCRRLCLPPYPHRCRRSH